MRGLTHNANMRGEPHRGEAPLSNERLGVAMTEGQALDYFNAALKHGGLCAGTNYMIDRDDTVWECMVFASGGIWDVKPNRRENTKSYHELRMFAAAQRRTTFETRTETPNEPNSPAADRRSE